jgi:choline monooxygenase
MTWKFDPRLSFASTIPSRYYTDAGVVADEIRKVFAATWQLAGHAERVREPGQFFTTTVAEEPVLIVRGNDGVLRAMSNVCRHRAGPIARGEGKRPVLQCGYHGWTYDLEGRLLRTPELDGIECFERPQLPHFRLEEWNDLLFVAISPDVPRLNDVLGEIVRHDFRGYRLAARKDWELNSNWKTYVDNYLEGYHIPIVHPSLFRELDYPKYWTETKRWYSIQHAPLKRAERIRIENADDAVSYYWVYPNLMLNVYPDNFSTNLIVPLGQGRTLTIFEWYFRDPEAPGVQKRIEETIAFSDEIQLEDIDICEAVQRGLRSSTYESGRYSPVRENGVHHFHGLYAEAMGIGS